ncbi:MAG TPA: hypothetical protein DCZ75_07235 [Geobacter sp.]|nr:hypothetical protein [Geobacter sp.]
MSKPACNIVSYRPDPEMLAANFTPRHAEALLDQAAILLDRCLLDHREYSLLDRAWSEFSHDLEIQEKQVELDRKRKAEAASKEEPARAPEAEAASEGLRAEVEERKEEEEGRVPEEGERVAPVEAAALEIRSSLDLRAEAALRKKELAGPGRPFALDEQRDLVLKRLCRDYEEAINRVSVAEGGLGRYFGYDGEPSPLNSWADTLGASITSLSIWTRDAIEWLVRYRLRTQTFTRAFSVRALMNRNAWGQLRHARDSFSVRFQVPLDLFQGFDNCRVRGISASLVGEAGTVPWSALVRLPDAALYLRSGKRVEEDQSTLPPCLLGRMENRRSVRISEVGGAVTHMNASPIGGTTADGQWSLEIFRPTGSLSEQFAQVDDLVIEIWTAGIPQGSGR